MTRIPQIVRFSTMVIVSLAVLQTQSGCNRAYYRQQADIEALALVEQKSNDPRWDQSEFSIALDSRSRFYDVYDPDYPPMPPDDPVSHQLMHHIDDKSGFEGWHEYGDIKELESPLWKDALKEYTKQTDDGKIRLQLDDAVKLGMVHSPTYQRQLETLYLSALDVSTERFRFDVQFFGGSGLSKEIGAGQALDPGGAGGTGIGSTLALQNDLRLERRFATAGELVVGFANSFVWQFAGPNKGLASSLLNFSLMQPLLRFGGRAVALEQLTIAERGLLANVRAMTQYRQGFYTRVATGSTNVSGPSRRGGFFGGTGLSGFTGQGSSGFGGVGDATGFGRSGFSSSGDTGGGAGSTGFAGGGAGTVGGFLGLLQQLQEIRNNKDTLSLQLRTLSLLEANLDAGLIDIAQVDQFRQSIETERANLLRAENSLQNSLESFKVSTLGLPPELPIELDDSLIKPFQLIDPKTTELQSKISQFINSFGDLPEEPEIAQLQKSFDTIDGLRKEMIGIISLIAEDLKKFGGAAEKRKQTMSDAGKKQLDADLEQLSDSMDALKTRFKMHAGPLKALRDGLKADNRKETADNTIASTVELKAIGGELSLVQARARLEQVSLQEFKLSSQRALDIARANRLDWMNNRAALVDTWRLIEFNANALESNLDIFFQGDLGTSGDNPVKFQAETGILEAGIRFDAPLTRLRERNNLRQQLINYQQARRQLIQFEDGVNLSLRQILRELKQLKLNLEIQRRAVAISIRRVDQTRETLNKPIPPQAAGAPPGQFAFGPTAALNLLTALSDLRNSQNNFMSVWLNFQVGRMRLMQEMGVMRIDEDGLWINESIKEAIRASEADLPLPPAVNEKWLRPPRRIPAGTERSSSTLVRPAALSQSSKPDKTLQSSKSEKSAKSDDALNGQWRPSKKRQ